MDTDKSGQKPMVKQELGDGDKKGEMGDNYNTDTNKNYK